MATAKAKAKAAFSYNGKQYQPGEEVEAPDHEIMQLVQQGHVEDPHGQSTQPGQHQAAGAQPQHGGHARHEQPHATHKRESGDDGDDD